MRRASHSSNSIRIRDIIKWWPLVLSVMLIAIGASIWARANDAQSYMATTTVVVTPLPQWDETFLGTDLVRDSGDATRTAATVAAELKSDHYQQVAARYLGGDWTPELVNAGVKVTAPADTNIVEISAKASDRDAAKKLASGYAAAAMADRWKTISAQLDSRIGDLRESSLTGAGDQQGANPSATEQIGRLQTLTIVRGSGSDPTLRIGSTSPSSPTSRLSLTATLIFAGLGGVLVGAVASGGLERLRRKKEHSESGTGDFTPESLVLSTNGMSHADAESR